MSLWFSADWAFPFPLVPLPAIWFPRPALPCPDIIMVGVVIVMGLISSEFSFRNPPVRRRTQHINKHDTSVALYPGLPTQVSVACSISWHYKRQTLGWKGLGARLLRADNISTWIHYYNQPSLLLDTRPWESGMVDLETLWWHATCSSPHPPKH